MDFMHTFYTELYGIAVFCYEYLNYYFIIFV